MLWALARGLQDSTATLPRILTVKPFLAKARLTNSCPGGHKGSLSIQFWFVAPAGERPAGAMCIAKRYGYLRLFYTPSSGPGPRDRLTNGVDAWLRSHGRRYRDRGSHRVIVLREHQTGEARKRLAGRYDRVLPAP